MKTLKDKIRIELDKKFPYDRFNKTNMIDFIFSYAVKEILKECLPEEKKKTGVVDMTFGSGDKTAIPAESNYDSGWNDCREKTKENLKKKGAKI